LSISESITGITYTPATGVFSLTAGYVIPTTTEQTNWTSAYNNMIVSAGVSGTTTKTLTLTQQDGGTITASWTDYDTAPVTSVFGRTGAVTAQSGDYTTAQVTEVTNLYYTDARARASLSFTAGSGAYNSTTGVITIPTNNNQITNGAGYITGINSSMVTTALGYTPVPNTRTLTINGTAYDLSADRSWTIAGTIGGLTTNYIPKATSATTLGNSLIYDNGIGIGIGTTSPSSALTIVGASNYNTILLHRDNTSNSAQRVGILSRDYSNTGSFGLIGGADISGTNKIVLVGFDGTAGANQIEFRTASTYAGTTAQRMIITSTGAVGIGKTNPATTLDVSGVITSLGFRTDATNTNYSLITRDGGGNAPLYVQSANTTAYQPIAKFQYGSATANAGTDVLLVGKDTSYFVNTNLGIGTNSPATIFHIASASAPELRVEDTTNSTIASIRPLDTLVRFGTFSNHPLDIYTNSNVIARFDTSGRLGLGTTSPSALLHLNIASNGEYFRGGASDLRQLQLISYDTISLYAGHQLNASSSNGELQFAIGGSAKMTLSSAGYLGLGETSPIRNLVVKGTSGNTTLSIVSGINDGAVLLLGDTNSDAQGQIRYENSDNSMRFRTTNTERMHITSAGLVGINATPSTTLHINGGASTGLTITGTTESYINFGDADNNVGQIYYGHSSNNMVFRTNDTNRMQIDSDGDVQITGAFEVLKLTSGYTSGGNYINFSNASGLLMTLGYSQNNSDNFYFRNYKNSSTYFYNNNSIYMTATSGGNVGIGTTSPNEKMELAGNLRMQGYIQFTTNLGAPTNTSNPYIERISGGGLRLASRLASTANAIITLETAGTERMRITSGGNVLIKTTSEYTASEAPLQVYGTINGQILHSNSSGQKWVSGVAYYDSNSYNIYDITNDRRLISARTDNTVIIGSAGVSGGGLLQVNGDVNINGNFKINGTTIGGGGGSGVTGSGTTNYIPKWTSSTSLGNSVISETGGNSISINAPYFGMVSGSNSLNFFVNTSTGIMSIGKASSYAIHMNQSNLVGINTTSFQSGNTLTCDGNAYFIGVVSASSYVTLSDIRLKTDVVELDKGLNEIIQLAPKSYKKDNSKEYGLIAQEVESILPQLVHNKNTYKSLKYMELIPIMVNAIKELKAELDELKK